LIPKRVRHWFTLNAIIHCAGFRILTLVAAGWFGFNAHAQQIYFSGLLTTALSNTTMDIDPDGHLVISAIDTNTDFGISVQTGNDSGDSAGAVSDLDVFNPDPLPVNASLSWSANGPTNQTLETLTLRRMASGGAMFADFAGLGASTASVALFSNNTLVACASGISPTNPLVTFTSAGTPGGSGLPLAVQPAILHPEISYGLLDVDVSTSGPLGTTGSTLTIPGQGTFYCTRVEVTPALPNPYSPSTAQVKTVAIKGSGDFGKLKDDNNKIGNDGFGGGYSYGLGWHSISFKHRAIGVTNFGISGMDAFDVDLFNANTYGSDLVALNPQPLPPGGGDFILSMSATGQFSNSTSDQSLGNWSLIPQGTGWALAADLSGAGSPNLNVELWQGCSLLSSFTATNSAQFLSFSDSPTASSVGLEPADDSCVALPVPFPWCWGVNWATPEQVIGPGGSVFIVDHVRIGPAAGSPALSNLTHVTYNMVGPQMLALLNPTVQRLGLNFAGNQHFPIGQANLSIAAGGQLNVSTAIGGTPGVEIALGRANYGELSVPAVQSPGSLSCEFHAMLDGVEDRIASTLTITGIAGGGTQFSADMTPLGATHYTILALNGGVCVGSVSNQPAGAFSVSSSATALASLRSDIPQSKSFVRVRFSPSTGPLPSIQLSPSLVVSGNEAVVMAENLARYVGPQNRTLVTGTSIDSFQVGSEALGYFGHGHSALGTAMLTADGGMLTVGHIGSGGSNGVSIDLNNALNVSLSLAPLDIPASGALLQESASGQFGSSSNHNLGSLQFSAVAGGTVQMTPDFSPVGASSYTIEVRQNGQLVQRFTGHTGTVGTAGIWPTALGELTSGSLTGAPGCTASFGQPVQIVIAGGPSLQGDELRVFPENPSQPIGKLQTLNLQARAFDSFVINGETITPALTPAFANISLQQGSGVTLTVPSLFGYDYNVDVSSTLIPNPFPWSPANSFFGDGLVHSITLPIGQTQQFYRLRVQAPGM
jgi:hypothetical protein